jgi:hypothetical protein
MLPLNSSLFVLAPDGPPSAWTPARIHESDFTPFDGAILCIMANTDFLECRDLEPLRALRRSPDASGESMTVQEAVLLSSNLQTRTGDVDAWLDSLGIHVSNGSVRIDATENSPVSEFYWGLGMPLKATDIRREATEVEFDEKSDDGEARVYVWFPISLAE